MISVSSGRGLQSEVIFVLTSKPKHTTPHQEILKPFAEEASEELQKSGPEDRLSEARPAGHGVGLKSSESIPVFWPNRRS